MCSTIPHHFDDSSVPRYRAKMAGSSPAASAATPSFELGCWVTRNSDSEEEVGSTLYLGSLVRTLVREGGFFFAGYE